MVRETTATSPAEERILADLYDAQRRAVTHGEGPLLIIAGAGTGKTRVITHRIAHLIATKRARPEEILALTFTEKAAAEMEERVDVLLPYGFTNVLILTFHAFGDRLLRERSLELGLPPDVRLLSQAEQVIFLRERLFRLPLDYYRPLGDPTRYLQALVTLFSRCRDEDVSPAEYLAYAEGLQSQSAAHPEDEALGEEARREAELARAYKAYGELKDEAGCIDFGDQVSLPLELLRTHPAALRDCQARFRYILVDEFQDTNYAQFELVKLLAAAHRNVTVVGDDDQSIYKFRGAAISNILGFMDHYPEATTVVLADNYRSVQPVLDGAYRLIRHNDPDRLEVRQGVDKHIVARRGGGADIRHHHFDTISSEGDFVARTIEEAVEAGERRWRDFAILVRANKDADHFIRALNVRSIPHRFSGNRGLYSRPEVRLAINFLRSVSDVTDSVALYYLASSEPYGLSAVDLSRCMNYANRINRPLHSIFERLEAVPELVEAVSQEGRATVAKLLGDLAGLAELALRRPTGEVLYTFLQESGWMKRLARRASAAAEEELQNLARLFNIIRSAEGVLRENRVSQFVGHLEFLMEAGDDPATAEADPDADAVHVLTVHRAKGLEFPVVFIVSLVEQRFPWRRRSEAIALPEPLIKDILPEGDFHIQEERRLFYVGMTRARDELHLTSAEDYGGVRRRKVSRFVLEALDLARDTVAATRIDPLETIHQHAPSESAEPEALGPIPEDEVITLSFRQIDDYLTCPLKYKFVNILRVPVWRHHSVVYGSAMHAAVAEYNRRRAAELPVSLDHLIRAFEGAWSSEGFLSLDHEERRLAEGRRALERFFAEQEAGDSRPTFVEKDFSFMHGANRVVGRWDRVDETPGETVVVDYKSSEVREQSVADKRAAESLQLAIYAMGYQAAFGRLPDAVQLHFIESGHVGRAVKTEDDLASVEERIDEAARGIRSRLYEATPTFQACRTCAFNEICPSTASSSR
ncbi:MAG: ATP-dependent DNA helicase [bacterium]|nr:ATP-dependent DNA helicase [bacterium]